MNPLIRAFSIIKQLKSLSTECEKYNGKNAAAGTKLIHKLEDLSSQLFSIKDNLGSLKENLIKAYTKAFTDISSSFALNRITPLLGILAHNNRDLLTFECSLLFFTTEELQKILNYKSLDKREILRIIQKSCEHILNNKIRGNELLSIVTFNTLHDILDTNSFVEAELSQIELSLMKFAENFTPKQKTRLLEDYEKMCDKLNHKPDEKLISEYEVSYKNHGKEGWGGFKKNHQDH